MLKTITTLMFVACAAGAWQQATAQSMTTVLDKESNWRYWDQGTDPGAGWETASFDDQLWSSGQAELGYGDNDENTTVSYGADAANKFAATYFRKHFQLAALPAANEKVMLYLKRDDGAIVFLNGVEIHRVNMPAGSVTHQTYASQDASSENEFHEIELLNAPLQVGENVIAVEVHQRSGSSSDVSFDAKIVLEEVLPPAPPVTCDDSLSATHISRFVSVIPGTQPDSLRIPATHTFQLLLQSGQPYSDSADGNTKGLFDFTGYVPVGGSSEDGYLSINHELGSFPEAGVSMLRIHFDSVDHVWNMSQNVPVDFSVVSGTGRNCSGTVTPWNTIITCEEILPTIDADNNGYQDIGWPVEIDPVTASVRSYNGNSQPQKLWKLGRMSHENIVIAADRKTAYEGNDENPGFIFKFVADQEENLSSGQLYVLKLDGPLDSVTTGSWIGIPNTTPEQCNHVRAFADAVGGTNFQNVEDVEINPVTGQIYFTSKASSRVYRFTDNGATVSDMEVFVGNSDFVYSVETEDGIVEEQWRGGVDNLTFDDAGNLYVLQDGGRNHIWMVPPCHSQSNPAVKLFAVTPAGCEPTGMTFSPDYRFMFVSFQHPDAANATAMIDATGAPVVFDRESAIVIARKEILGPDAVDDTPTGIEERTDAGRLQVYPNPANDVLHLGVAASEPAKGSVRVVDMRGATVRLQHVSFQSGDNAIRINVSSLADGIYSVIVNMDGRQLTSKFVKQ